MLYRLGTAVMDDGQLDQAEGYIELALAAWRRLGHRDRVAGSLRRLGYIAMARRRPGDAGAWFTQALAAYRELADARHVAVTLSNLAEASSKPATRRTRSPLWRRQARSSRGSPIRTTRRAC